MDIAELALRYDNCPGYVVCTAEPPTDKSIKHIQKELGLTLPKSLIEFAKHSELYGNWLASLGPDFESGTHILELNRYWHSSEAEEQLPDNLIVINVGYDEDLNCLDTDIYNDDSGEFYITYWSPGVTDSDVEIYDSFPTYIAAQIELWEEG